MDNHQLTVKELIMHLERIVKKYPSIANKKIVISDDNEGNGYHGLFYGLTIDVAEFTDLVYDSTTTDPKEFVILG